MGSNIMANKISLYKTKEKCCGCGVCAFVCPKGAINLIEDELGFRYPNVNQDKCISCKKCIYTCPYNQHEINEVNESYAGRNINAKQINKSSSGGIFSAIATEFLNSGGSVCGAAWVWDNGKLNVKHIIIDSCNELYRLQGSKYAQSNVSDCYKEANSILKEGKKVLFSGTPCQVAGFKSLFRKYESQIYTIDIICHGVPNIRFFNEYLNVIEKRYGKKAVNFNFRDKEYGWGLDGTIKFDDDYILKVSPGNSSYYNLFLAGEIYRESCYKCPYASLSRIGDITIGDYWGVEDYSSELLFENGGTFKVEEGISCILENSNKGKKLLELSDLLIEKYKVDLNKITIVNTQLIAPSKHTNKRNKIFNLYIKSGYTSVERLYKREKIIWYCKCMVPDFMKEMIKKVIVRK